MTRILGVFLAYGILLTPVNVSHASPQEVQALTRPLQYEVSVVLKLIHVYVTDKKGNPVRDLTVNDFTITDNGQPMTITDFEKRVLKAAAGEHKEENRPGMVTEPVMPPPSPAARQTARKFFFFFDFAYNNARGIIKAKTAARHFLETQVRPDDEVGILSYSMLKGLIVHEYLTTDRAKVHEVIDSIGSKDITGRASEMEDWYWRLVQDPLYDPGGPKPKDTSEGDPYRLPAYAYEAKVQREEAKKLAENYMLKLTALAKSMRYVQGQKHFILFSSGLPTSLVYGAQAGNPGQTSRAGRQFDLGDPVLKSRNEAMSKEFSASGCTLFAFDTRESAKGIDLFGYDSRTLETGGRGIFSKEGVFQDSASVLKDDKTTGLDFLKLLTDATGGKYYSNINRYEKNLDEVQGLTGTYYVLGYPINEKWDGSYHEVKVEVKRKGCEVRAQAGYFNPKPFNEYSPLEKQLHLFDLALNERAFSRMPVTVPMRALTSAAEGISRLAVLAKVPGEVTAKLVGKRVEFVAIFFDGKGEISDMVREETDPASFRGRDMAFVTGATLRPGDYACRLVIRDMDTGLSAVGSTKATVGKPAATSLQLGTPLMLEEGTGSFFLDAGARKTTKTIPFGEVYPFDKTQLSPILGEIPVTAVKIQVVIPFSVPGGHEPDLALSAYLVNSTSGERLPVTFSRTDRIQKGPLEILTLELPMTSFAPGTYFLHFYAEDRASKSLGHTFAAIVIPKR